MHLHFKRTQPSFRGTFKDENRNLSEENKNVGWTRELTNNKWLLLWRHFAFFIAASDNASNFDLYCIAFQAKQMHFIKIMQKGKANRNRTSNIMDMYRGSSHRCYDVYWNKKWRWHHEDCRTKIMHAAALPVTNVCDMYRSS